MSRFAYADHPYFGCGARCYDHPEWDRQGTHLELITRLSADYPDGWALSTRSADLAWQLSACPDDCLIAAWVKPFSGSARRGVRIFRVWEPVIYRTIRRNTQLGERTRDALITNPTRQLGFIGAQSQRFNRWILDLLGYTDGDVIDDLFPAQTGWPARWRPRCFR
jgi:hypothetical protein